MGDCLQACIPLRYVSNQPSRPTQPPTLSGTGNEYRPKGCEALWLESKGRYGSFHLWINVWVAGKTVWSRVYTCHRAPRYTNAKYSVATVRFFGLIQNLSIIGRMDFTEGCRADITDGGWPLLTIMLLSQVKTICVLLLTAILRVNVL